MTDRNSTSRDCQNTSRLKRLLFVCNQGQHRSPTAAQLLSDAYETRSRGVFSEDNALTGKDVLWADIIVVMEDVQRKELVRKFPEESLSARILSADIPDVYQKNSPKLKEELRQKIGRLLKS